MTRISSAFLLAALLVIVGFPQGATTHPPLPQEPKAPPEEKAHDLLGNLKFRNIGPAVGGGRVAAVAGIPNRPNVYYVGAAGGGVFKTIDGGFSWKAIFEKEATASIGAIALAPSDPDNVWVGTGEANLRNDVVTGHGVYFSPDGGANWRFMGLGNVGHISQVVVSPINPDVVYVAAVGHAWAPNPERGVYRTLDGGRSWQRVLYVNDTTGAADLVMQSGNPMVLYAAMWEMLRHPWVLTSGGPGSGIYRSTDGGTTWKKLSEGLPQGPLGRIGLAVAPSNPSHIYALVEAKQGMLWGSTDFGDHWTSINNSHLLDVRPFYFSHLAVAPNDENKIYFLSYNIAESTDGGKTAHPIDKGVHPDHHAIWIDPTNPNRIIEGNDGGVYLTVDGGENWRYLDNLPIEQFYMVAADNAVPYNLCGGLQDNFGWCGPSNSGSRPGIIGSDWYTAVGGDGEYVVPAPSMPNIVYADAQNGEIQRLDNKTGLSINVRPYLPTVDVMTPAELKYRFNWTSPIAVSDRDPNVVYLGGNVLFKTTDGGAHWNPISPDLTRNDKAKQVTSGGSIEYDISGAETYDTILSIAVSTVDPNVIWVGTDDGLIQVTRDGGQHWENVAANIHNLPAWGRLQQIEASPFDAANGYAAVDLHENDDNRPYVFKTHDYGKTWTAIARGLPADVPARVIRENPNQRGMLVLGTDTGLFFSKDDGGSWQPLKGNFPTAPIYDLKFVKSHHDLVVATHGRGLFVLDDIAPLEQLTPQIQAGSFHLFSSSPAELMHMWNKHGETQPGFIGPNPPAGAAIDYYLQTEIKTPQSLKEKHETPVKITITAPDGTLVKTFYGPSDAGFNRATWDLSYDAPKKLLFEKEGSADEEEVQYRRGPRVVPGTYKVGVMAGKFAEVGAVTVLPDARFKPDMNAFAEQNRLALELSDEVSDVNDIINRLDIMHNQLATMEKLVDASENDKQLQQAYGPVVQQSKTLDKKLNEFKGKFYNIEEQHEVGEDSIHYLQRFHDRLEELFFSVSRPYDTAPNELQIEEAQKLRGELQTYLAQFNDLVKTDIAAYNRLALDHGAGTLFVGNPIELSSTPVRQGGK